MIVRVWRHGDTVVGRIFSVGDTDEPNEAVRLSGREALLEWLEVWLDEFGDT